MLFINFLGTKQATGDIGVSIGVKDEDKDRFDMLYGAGARIFCIDVAHGHHILVKNMLKWINENVRGDRDEMTLIAGNIATPDAYNALSDWGADAAKVGIGPSPVCRTRYNTGVGVPQLYALETIFKESMTHAVPISIIADGGISHVGDIAKALKYADAVMLGSMLAGTSETPGSAFRNEQGDWYKVYGGSASGENKGANRFVEGVVKTVKFNGEVKYILREIEQGLQSTFSYVGASNHNEFQEYCEFLHISGGAHGESKV
jgi:IMP dehydrogenase